MRAGELTEIQIELDPDEPILPRVDLWSYRRTYSYVDSARVSVLVQDAQDELGDLVVEWESDRDGPLPSRRPDGSGVVSLAAMLSRGPHELEVRVADSDGFVSRLEIVVEVVSVRPTAYILGPAGGTEVAAGDTVEFVGRIYDYETPLEDILVRWSSTRDGLLDETPASPNGTVAFKTAALSSGVHRVSLTATDHDGQESVVATVDLDVLPAPAGTNRE